MFVDASPGASTVLGGNGGEGAYVFALGKPIPNTRWLNPTWSRSLRCSGRIVNQ
jgi:hypothetical protein